MKYKIAFFLPRLESHGGVTVAVQTLTHYLLSKEHDIHFFPIGITNISSSINIHPINATKIKEQISLAKELFHKEESNSVFDLIISNTMPSHKIVNQINHNSKHLIVLHQASLFTKKDLLTRLKRRFIFPKLFNHKDIIMVSSCLEQEFIKMYPYLKLHSTQTIANAINEKYIIKLSNKYHHTLKNDFILCLGRQTKNKNISMLLHAFQKIRNKAIKLVLLGEGRETKKLKNLVKQLHIENRVIFIKWIENPYPWIKHAKILISTSKSECLPLVLLEGLLLKTPIISTNIKCGPNEILTGALANFLVPLDDTKILTQKINEALISYPKISSKYIEKFHVPKLAQQYLNYIDKLN